MKFMTQREEALDETVGELLNALLRARGYVSRELTSGADDDEARRQATDLLSRIDAAARRAREGHW